MIRAVSLHSFPVLQRIPGADDAALTCVAWCGDASGTDRRLFSAGLDGQIIEHDLDTLRPLSITDSHGGAIWALAREPKQKARSGSPFALDRCRRAHPAAIPCRSANPQAEGEHRFAVACDDGAVRIYTVEDGAPGARYTRSLPRTEGRVLSLAWHPNGRVVVAGDSTGCIRCWDLDAGRELLRITAGDGSGRELCVWALLVLPDGTIVSGDSNGNTQWWDGNFGTRIQSLTQHGADVLALAASPDGRLVFSSGSDNQVAAFQLVASQGDGPAQWVFLSAKRPHTHDVRSLAMVSPKEQPGDALLVSGGNDAQVVAYPAAKFLKVHPIRVCGDPQRPLTTVSSGLPSASAAVSQEGPAAAAGGAAGPVPRVLCMQPSHVDVWRLGRAGTTVFGMTVTPEAMSPATSNGHAANGHHAQPKKAAAAAANGTAQKRPRAESPEPLGDGANGRWVELREGDPVDVASAPQHLARIRKSGKGHLLSAAISPSGAHVAFSDSSRVRLFTVGAEGGEQTDPDPSLLRVRKRQLSASLPAAAHLAFTSDSAQLVLASPQGRILVVDVESGDIVRSFEEACPSPKSSTAAPVKGADTPLVRLDSCPIRSQRARSASSPAGAPSAALVGSPVISLEVSTDGQWLAAATRQTVHLYNLESMRYHGRLPPLEASPCCLVGEGGALGGTLGPTGRPPPQSAAGRRASP